MDQALHLIPKDLRASALPIESGSESGLSWDKETAIRALRSLKATKVAVDEVAVYRSEPFGVVETEENWTCSRESGEAAFDYAERTRRGAEGYIRQHAGDDLTLYLLWLDDQRGAA